MDRPLTANDKTTNEPEETFPQFSDEGFSTLEREILDWWRENDLFRRSVESRPADRQWIFNEGPPTVNGNPGLHHVISRALKDMFCRYKTMRGYRVERKGGWDTHGLPVEIALEKQLGLKEKGEIETKVGVAEFNRMARELVYKHINSEGGWNAHTEKMGYWVDLDNPYITCTNDYIESVWWALSEFFNKGLIYRGYKVVPQCPHCETPLSSHELAQGYKDVRDPSLYVKIPVRRGEGERLNLPEGTRILVWTTTPWTLISNVALAVGSDIDYTLVTDPATGEHYILAEARRSTLDPDGAWEVVASFKGSALAGLGYERLFDYVEVEEKAFYIVTGDFVSTEDGTGIVHIAPAFGQDDYEVAKKYNLPVMQPVTGGGRFTDVVTDWAGRTVKTLHFEERVEEGVDKEIVIALKGRGLVLKSSNDYEHSYPHCWRCHNPLIYYARDSWFIRTTAYAPEMIEQNKRINWQPPEIGTGRFGNWLEENKDWSLSRDRYWGTPLPIWVNESDPTDMFCVGSVEEFLSGEFEEEDGSVVPGESVAARLDLHKPFVDQMIFRRDGKIYRRTSELIDVWFDSGSVPFAQYHYPFENREKFEGRFPADFISEGVDQTRGWFYTMHAISTGVFNQPASRNILVNGHLLDKKGRKMSKNDGNTVDAFEMIDRYGADAIRWYLVTNSPPWKPLLWNEEEIPRTVHSFFRTLTSTYNFFALYAKVDGFVYSEARLPESERAEVDRWILSALTSTVTRYTELMDEYDPTRAMRLVSEFTVEQLSNWYVRRNRRRFWKGDISTDKTAAYQTLYECLIAVVKMMAPLAPFIPERIYRALNDVTRLEAVESVHLALLPEPDPSVIDADLERRMDRAQRVVALARMLREKSRLKVRQPLRRMLIPVASDAEREDYRAMEEIIKEELNIKAIEYADAATSDVVRMKAKANYKSLGPRFGKEMKQVAAAVSAMTSAEVVALGREGSLTINAGSDTFVLFPEDVEVIHEEITGWLVASEGTSTVALDTELDEELINEGLAREFINRVQNLRKDSGLDLTDRISLGYVADDSLQTVLEGKRDYIMEETLAIRFGPYTDATETGSTLEVDLNGQPCRITLERVAL